MDCRGNEGLAQEPTYSVSSRSTWCLLTKMMFPFAGVLQGRSHWGLVRNVLWGVSDDLHASIHSGSASFDTMLYRREETLGRG